MMTQDRANHPLATPTSPRNLNPSAPAFRQGQAAPASPKNLNPSAPAFCHSPGGEKTPAADSSYSGAETRAPGLLTNGDIHANGTNYMVPLGGSGAGMPSGAGPQPQGAHQSQSPQSTTSMGVALAPRPLLAASTQSNPQSVASPQQPGVGMGVPESLAGQRTQQQTRASSQNNLSGGTGEAGDHPPNGAVGVDEVSFEPVGEAEELEGATGGQEYEYPDEVLAPIRKQMQFYFSNENLPNDKFLNQHMDSDKFIPLELFLDFGRIKPICNSVDQLLQAVESSSILELSEDRKKVRVSQCRKTLTLRGFPASATEEDVRQFILEMGAAVPTHIEFVMYKEKYSVWYVSFKDESAALNSFFQFHNQKAVYKDHNIGCCIKSSGTLAAAGYFPSSEESNQRRMAHHNQAAAVAAAAAAAAATAPVHAVPSAVPQAQPQQAQALMQPFSTMQLHSYMAGSPAGIYYQQTPQGPYLGPYMTGMIQSWPTAATTAMDPGLIMQNNGLQPQHVRTPMARPHLIPTGTGAQHRFNSRPQRVRQNNLERSASERPSERPPVVSVTGSARSSPRGVDGSTQGTVAAQGAYLPRRTTGRDDMSPQVMPQPQAVSHQFVTPMVTPQQQQQQHLALSAAPAGIVSQVALEPIAVPHYQAAPQHHQQSVIVHTALTGATPAHPPATPQTTSNPPPPPSTQQQMHHHHHHHSLPPPMMPPQQHHHQQQQQLVHHHQSHHPAQHSSQHHHQQQQQQLPPPQPHQQPPQVAHHHHSHPSQHHMMAAHQHHQHSPQQQHHQTPPSQQHHQQQQQHQQPSPGNRTERRGRRKREDGVRNQRSERNQANRANFNSQTPAADNFTMEANSFPPLPGALNSLASLEISHESRMSDIVRGVSRLPGLGNSGTPRASSNTPSPVPTPVPVSLTSVASLGQHHGASASVISDSRSLDDGDSPLDDDATSSSQEDVDTDVNSESRSVRSEPQSLSYASEPSAPPTHPRSQKASTPGASPATVSAQRQTESRHGSAQAHGRGGQQYQVSPIVVSAATSAFEAPKLSYAQILAVKNHEAANIAGAGEMSSGTGPPLTTNSGTPNGPGSAAHSNHSAAQSGNSSRASNQPPNAFRDHGSYPGGQQQQQQAGFRSSQRSSAKDLSRSEGPQMSSRPPNGSRRNSKENRTSNKFDRRKPDTR